MKKTSYEIRDNILETYDHLDAIEITRGINGYPTGLHAAVTGFNSMEEAERIAEEFGGEVVSVHRKAGWSLWESKGWATEAYGMDRFGEDDGHHHVNTPAAVDELLRDYLSGGFDEIATVESLAEITEKFTKLSEAAEFIDDDEILLVDATDYTFTTEKVSVMNFCEDSNYYAIAVELEDIEEEDEDEDEE